MRGVWPALYADLGRQRDFAHISLEWLGDDSGPMLSLAVYRRGHSPQRALHAEAHHHGRWMRWYRTDGVEHPQY